MEDRKEVNSFSHFDKHHLVTDRHIDTGP